MGDRASVEEGSVEDIEVVVERDGGKVAEVVDLWVAGHQGGGAPRKVLG